MLSVRSCEFLNATNNSSTHVYVTGPRSAVNLQACPLRGSSTITGFNIENGCTLRIIGCHTTDNNNGIVVPNIGTAPTLQVSSLIINNSTTFDINVQHPGTKGVIDGIAQKVKLSLIH